MTCRQSTARSPAALPGYAAEVGACLAGLGAACTPRGAEECFGLGYCEEAAIVGRTNAAGGVFQTDTTGGVDHYQALCAGNAAGPENVILVQLAAPALMVFDIIAANYDTALFVRGSCDEAGSEVACDDDGGGGTRSRISTMLAAGTWYVFVDGFAGSSGTATLQISRGCADNGACDAGQRCVLPPPDFEQPCGCADGDPDCFDCFFGETCLGGLCRQACGAGFGDCFGGDLCTQGACTPVGSCVAR